MRSSAHDFTSSHLETIKSNQRFLVGGKSISSYSSQLCEGGEESDSRSAHSLIDLRCICVMKVSTWS